MNECFVLLLRITMLTQRRNECSWSFFFFISNFLAAHSCHPSALSAALTTTSGTSRPSSAEWTGRVQDSKKCLILAAKVFNRGEHIAPADEYFISRKLYPNADFHSGIIYQAMGLPVAMFPVMFAIPRTVGWLAQWQEMVTYPEQKITRPRQIFIGQPRRDLPMQKT
ncbi:MAG TPA: citrate/2-methylcitrate synthase [Candidatus Udaeobacter sp.]|jgi:hypothetical protein